MDGDDSAAGGAGEADGLRVRPIVATESDHTPSPAARPFAEAVGGVAGRAEAVEAALPQLSGIVAELDAAAASETTAAGRATGTAGGDAGAAEDTGERSGDEAEETAVSWHAFRPFRSRQQLRALCLALSRRVSAEEAKLMLRRHIEFLTVTRLADRSFLAMLKSNPAAGPRVSEYFDRPIGPEPAAFREDVYNAMVLRAAARRQSKEATDTDGGYDSDDSGTVASDGEAETTGASDDVLAAATAWRESHTPKQQLRAGAGAAGSSAVVVSSSRRAHSDSGSRKSNGGAGGAAPMPPPPPPNGSTNQFDDITSLPKLMSEEGHALTPVRDVLAAVGRLYEQWAHMSALISAEARASTVQNLTARIRQRHRTRRYGEVDVDNVSRVLSTGASLTEVHRWRTCLSFTVGLLSLVADRLASKVEGEDSATGDVDMDDGGSRRPIGVTPEHVEPNGPDLFTTVPPGGLPLIAAAAGMPTSAKDLESQFAIPLSAVDPASRTKHTSGRSKASGATSVSGSVASADDDASSVATSKSGTDTGADVAQVDPVEGVPHQENGAEGDGSINYRGVKMASPGRWQVTISMAGRARYVGVFPTQRQAALAWDQAARLLRGEGTATNLPKPAVLPRLSSSLLKAIAEHQERKARKKAGKRDSVVDGDASGPASFSVDSINPTAALTTFVDAQYVSPKRFKGQSLAAGDGTVSKPIDKDAPLATGGVTADLVSQAAVVLVAQMQSLEINGVSVQNAVETARTIIDVHTEDLKARERGFREAWDKHAAKTKMKVKKPKKQASSASSGAANKAKGEDATASKPDKEAGAASGDAPAAKGGAGAGAGAAGGDAEKAANSGSKSAGAEPKSHESWVASSSKAVIVVPPPPPQVAVEVPGNVAERHPPSFTSDDLQVPSVFARRPTDAVENGDGLIGPPARDPLSPPTARAYEWMVKHFAAGVHCAVQMPISLDLCSAIAAYYTHLIDSYDNWGLHLLVVPLGMLRLFEFTLQRLMPRMSIHPYIGSPRDRMITRRQWDDPSKDFPIGPNSTWHVILTTPTIVDEDMRYVAHMPFTSEIVFLGSPLSQHLLLPTDVHKPWHSICGVAALHRVLFSPTPAGVASSEGEFASGDTLSDPSTLYGPLRRLPPRFPWRLCMFLLPDVFARLGADVVGDSQLGSLLDLSIANRYEAHVLMSPHRAEDDPPPAELPNSLTVLLDTLSTFVLNNDFHREGESVARADATRVAEAWESMAVEHTQNSKRSHGDPTARLRDAELLWRMSPGEAYRWVVDHGARAIRAGAAGRAAPLANTPPAKHNPMIVRIKLPGAILRRRAGLPVYPVPPRRMEGPVQDWEEKVRSKLQVGDGAGALIALGVPRSTATADDIMSAASPFWAASQASGVPTSSKYKGVYQKKNSVMWAVRVNRLHLGSFATEAEAGAAYRNEWIRTRGEYLTRAIDIINNGPGKQLRDAPSGGLASAGTIGATVVAPAPAAATAVAPAITAPSIQVPAKRRRVEVATSTSWEKVLRTKRARGDEDLPSADEETGAAIAELRDALQVGRAEAVKRREALYGVTTSSNGQAAVVQSKKLIQGSFRISRPLDSDAESPGLGFAMLYGAGGSWNNSGFAYVVRRAHLVLGRLSRPWIDVAKRFGVQPMGGSAAPLGAPGSQAGFGGVDVHVSSDRSVAHQHARLSWDTTSRTFKIQALSSSVGVTVDGKRVVGNGASALLRSRSLVRIGDILFYFLLPRDVAHGYRRTGMPNVSSGGVPAEAARGSEADDAADSSVPNPSEAPASDRSGRLRRRPGPAEPAMAGALTVAQASRLYYWVASSGKNQATKQERDRLATELGCTAQDVTRWLLNYRQRVRRRVARGASEAEAAAMEDPATASTAAGAGGGAGGAGGDVNME